MARTPAPLDNSQAELLSVVRSTHETVLLARRLRASEQKRRIAEARLRLDREFERAQAQIMLDIEREIQQHAAAEDEAIIAAYNGGVPVRQIALHGFGNQYDGNVHERLTALRNDGRIGNRVGYQRNASDPVAIAPATVEFPKPVPVLEILEDVNRVHGPRFESVDTITLVEPSAPGENDGVYVTGVRLTMDARDPYFARILSNARPGTPHLRATTATLYRHPATQEVTVLESREEGDILWDHPVARWVKDHRDLANEGFGKADGGLFGEVIEL